jgi:sodium-coupled neutral amino acid transporter 7/8
MLIIVNIIIYIIPLQCHLSSVQVYAGLKRRSIRAFTIIAIISVFICLCIYTLTGVFGYLTFSTRETGCIASDILRSYCPRDVMVDVARVLMGVIMVTSYPILTFCGRLESSLHVPGVPEACKIL